jgi:hypothetical protein
LLNRFFPRQPGTTTRYPKRWVRTANGFSPRELVTLARMRLRAPIRAFPRSSPVCLFVFALAFPALAQNSRDTSFSAAPRAAIESRATTRPPSGHGLEPCHKRTKSARGLSRFLRPGDLCRKAAGATVASSQTGSLVSEGGRKKTLQQVVSASPDFDSVPALKRDGLSLSRQRAWLLLGLAEHGAAFFDARTTRDAMTHYRELDPLMRPFAHSAALYPVMQIAPAGLDWLAIRLAASRHRWLRRIWWLPQTAAAAGFVWSGVHNFRLPGSSSRSR